MAHGKYLHEVLEEATTQDIAYYMALRKIEFNEEEVAHRRARARAQAQSQRR